MTTLQKVVRRQTIGALDCSFGSDRGKRLVVSLEQGDLIAIKPARAKAGRTERISLFDLYRMAIRIRVNRAQLDKAREKLAKQKAAKAEAKWKRSISRSKLNPT